MRPASMQQAAGCKPLEGRHLGRCGSHDCQICRRPFSTWQKGAESASPAVQS